MSSKKRKHEPEANHEVDTSKPTAVFKPTGGRAYTLSIALPGSIISNAQSPELKNQLAGHIARAAAVFCVDEIVVFDDVPKPQYHKDGGAEDHRSGTTSGSYTGNTDPSHFLMHLLSYLETPPNFRQWLFPMHPNLQRSGALPSLDMPHHLREHEWCQYREGITLEAETRTGQVNGDMGEHGEKKKKKRKHGTEPEPASTLVHVGLAKPVTIQSSILPNTRVTLRFSDDAGLADVKSSRFTAEAVAPSVPREEAGYYWGYSARPASSLSTVLTESPFEGGYDLTFGTSERGSPLSSITNPSSDETPVPDFKHMLVVFGGVAGLEVATKADEELRNMGVTEPSELFDYWVNLCPGQGSRTVRTEEAVWMGLMGLRDIVLEKGEEGP